MLTDKIKEIRELKEITETFRQTDKKIVFTNGCFDILHYGHIKYLEDAKGYGDLLIVAVNSDSSVRKIKGEQRPFIKEEDRMRVLAGLESVDYVTLFEEETPYDIINRLRPDVLVKGGDWQKEQIIGKDIVESYNGKVIPIPYLKGYSTTALINKIRKTVEIDHGKIQGKY